MTERRRRSPRRTARGGLPVQGAKPPRPPVTPITRRRGPFIALALVVVVLTATLAGRRIVATGYFEVRSPAVAGAGRVTEEEVRAAAALQGKQIWQVQEDQVAATVSEVPGVREARVQRRWPNRVTIAIEERIPAAVWRVGAMDAVVDEDGYVLDAPVMGGMPAISHLDGTTDLSAGDRVDGDAVRLAFTLIGRLPAAVGQRVARFEYSSAGGLDVITDRGLRARFGDGQNIDYKLELWRSVSEQAKKDKITPSEMDLRFGQWAAIR